MVDQGASRAAEAGQSEGGGTRADQQKGAMVTAGQQEKGTAGPMRAGYAAEAGQSEGDRRTTGTATRNGLAGKRAATT